MNKIQEYLNSLIDQILNMDYDKIADQAIAQINNHEKDKHLELANQVSTVLKLTQEIKTYLVSIDAGLQDSFLAIFNSENMIHKRITETLRAILVLSMIPSTPPPEKYRSIILSSRAECLVLLEKNIVPELIKVLKKFKKTTEKIKQINSPEDAQLTVSENLKILYMLHHWVRRYDNKMDHLNKLMYTP